MRARAQRTLCADHLASIFRGSSAYQATFAGSLPYAGTPLGASWLPDGAEERPYASNSRHVYLLLRHQYVGNPGDFVCPTAPAPTPMRADFVGSCEDFAEAGHLSYATLNMAGPGPSLRPTLPVAFVSDANPLFVGARFDQAADPDRTNSRAHRGKGQTVLTLDGSVHWLTRPVYGPKRDNLWLIGNLRSYVGTEEPRTDDDVQLVPGFPATDPSVRRVLHH